MSSWLSLRLKAMIYQLPCLNTVFQDLKDGDDWCLCAPRWVEAYEANCAPKIYLTKTHEKTLELVPLKILREYALDIN